MKAIRNRRISAAACVLTLVSVWAATALDDVPMLIDIQGRLEDGGALPSMADMPITLNLYDDATGGALLYAEYDTVDVTDGLYHTYLGDNPSGAGAYLRLDEALNAGNTSVWLALKVDGVTLEPRQHLGAAPYAVHVRGLNVSSYGHVGQGTDSALARWHVVVTNTGSLGRSIVQVQTGGGTTWGEAGVQIATPEAEWSLFMDDHTVSRLPRGALGLAQGAEEASMVWTTNGLVGIGTATPATPLDVDGDILISGDYYSRSTITSYVYYGASDFQFSSEYGWAPQSFDETYYSDLDNVTYAMFAPEEWMGLASVHLPDGAQINDVRAYFVDNGTTNDIITEVWLTRRGFDDLNCIYLAHIDGRTTNASPDYTQMTNTTSIASNVVDNANYSYRVGVRMETTGVSTSGVSLGFCGVRLEYETTRFVP